VCALFQLSQIINQIIAALTGADHHHGPASDAGNKGGGCCDVDDGEASCCEDPSQSAATLFETCPCNSADPVGALERIKHMGEEIEEYEHSSNHPHWEGRIKETKDPNARKKLFDEENGEEGSDTDTETFADDVDDKEDHDNRKLILTSLNTYVSHAN